jgi:hypothetical protein
MKRRRRRRRRENGDRHYIYGIYCIITHASAELDITLLKTGYQLT